LFDSALSAVPAAGPLTRTMAIADGSAPVERAKMVGRVVVIKYSSAQT
jgi:hypothetical protein